MKHLPIFIDVKNKPVIVIGGGDVAFRKTQSLLRAEAKVTVLAKSFITELKELDSLRLTLIQSEYHVECLRHKWLVIAATDNNEVNQTIHDDAIAERIWVNVVDSPKLCQFIFPSIVDRSPLVIAISSGGAAPVLARLWREKLESLIPLWTGKLVSIAASYRELAQQKIDNLQQRRYVWERVFRGKANQLAAQQRWRDVEQAIKDEINTEAKTNAPKGVIHYVGIGPNDPELITLKALQLMQLADTIIYDELLSEDILNLCRKDAHYFEFNETKNKKDFQNTAVTECLISEYKQGKIICRLTKNAPKQEHLSTMELSALKQNTIDFQIVSGVPA